MDSLGIATPVNWPQAAASSPRRRLGALLALSCVAVLQGTDPQINAVALASAGHDLGMSPASTSMAASIATLMLAAAMLGVGILGDRLGRKRVLVWGTLGIALGCALCAAAPTFWVLLLGRVVVGVSTAASFGMSLSLLPTIFRPEELPKVCAVWLGILSCGMAVGTVGAGFLADRLGWRLSYLVVPAAALIFTGLSVRWVPESRESRPHRFDTAAVLLAAAGLTALIAGLGQAAQRGWTSPMVLGGVALAALLFALFTRHEKNRPDPGFPVRLFKTPEFAAACLAGAAFNFANATLGGQLPLLWQRFAGYSAGTTSLLVATMPAGMVAGAFAAAQVQRRTAITDRAMFVSGMLLLAAGTAVAALQRAGSGPVPGAVGLGLVGIGIMWTQTPESAVVMRNAPPDMVGAVGAVKPAVGQLGYGLGFGLVAPVVAGIERTGMTHGLDPARAYEHGLSMALTGCTLLFVVCAVLIAFLMRHAPGKERPVGCARSVTAATPPRSVRRPLDRASSG